MKGYLSQGNFFVWFLHQWEKSFLDLFPHTSDLSLKMDRICKVKKGEWARHTRETGWPSWEAVWLNKHISLMQIEGTQFQLNPPFIVGGKGVGMWMVTNHEHRCSMELLIRKNFFLSTLDSSQPGFEGLCECLPPKRDLDQAQKISFLLEWTYPWVSTTKLSDSFEGGIETFEGWQLQ